MGDTLSASHPVLLTSVPPATHRTRGGQQVGERYQRDCIESWVESGFRVISVNPMCEVDAVRSLKLPLEVVEANGDGRPTIASLLELAQSTGARLCGIVNADCIMVRIPGLAQQLDQETTHGLYFTERIDVGDHGEFVPGSCGGFDGFYFLPSELGTNFDATLRLGDPWWDYWLPCIAALRGIELFRTSSPMLLHLAHERRWDPQTWEQNSRYFRAQIIEERSRLASEGALDVLQFPDVSAEKSQAIALAVYDWLRSQSEALHFCADQVVSCGVVEFRSMRDYHAIAAPRAIKKLTNRNNVLEDRVGTIRTELDELKRENNRLVARERMIRTNVRRAIGTLDRMKSQPLRPESTKAPLLQRAAQRLLGSDASGESPRSLIVSWAGLIRPRTLAVLAALLCLGLILFIAPIVTSAQGGYVIAYWLAGFGCVAIAAAACAISLARYVAYRGYRYGQAPESVRKRLTVLLDRMHNGS